ncbi:outer membrane beta-barrel protein [Acidobacterium sp. S8]|uniref:outer membrane beta-barrel protein n=1 Tax=Acidobacterium sp. S8 TaxID=1641854 RepID=UPI00131B6FD1|nr:outer membrane beta-barrel protein [Acidobacterium sp. S8]
MLKKLAGFVLLLLPMSLTAQVATATEGGGQGLSFGAEYSNFSPDWGHTRLQGIAVVGDLDGIFLKNLGIEGEARWLNFNQPSGETEQNYLIGPRYRLYRYHKFSFYAKFLMGGGFITYPNKIGTGSYFAYVPGGTVEYHLNHHWAVRGDYEYQTWPAAPGLAFTYPRPSRGLTPNGFSAGVSYHLF